MNHDTFFVNQQTTHKFITMSNHALEGIYLMILRNPKNFLSHPFPKNITGDKFTITLKNISKSLINFNDKEISPAKKKKTKNKEKRHTEVQLRFNREVVAKSWHVERNSNSVFVIGRMCSDIILNDDKLTPDEAHTITYYEKKKGTRKVLNAGFFYQKDPVSDINVELSKYEKIIAIDTNTITLPNGEKASAVTGLEATIRIISDNACRLESGAMHQGYIERDLDKPELHCINLVLDSFFKRNPEMLSKKIAIITDTEFDLLAKINRREIPFYKDKFLPVNMSVFYATADSGSTEFFANQLIRACDRESTIYAKQHSEAIR